MPSELLTRIRRQNLDVYRVSPGRLKEDVSQESEIAKDYRGRLVYELLQNADDAMQGGSASDRIEFTLTDDELWVGNNGRPLDEADVLGLSGIGASSKSESDGPRRASIGHKGMGFKSVLEITDTPEAYSTIHSFRMDAQLAFDDVAQVMSSVEEPEPKRIPAMRFPWDTTEAPPRWETAHAVGLNTMFRFPLRDKLTTKQRATLASRVMDLPLTSVLFLKHLEEVSLEVATTERQERRLLRVRREEWDGSSWVPVAGLIEDGTYRIHLQDGDQAWSFILVHDAQLEIGEHRGGLTAAAWEGVELSEVSLATPWPADQHVPGEWRRFHVFLPTNELTPYRLMVNGAFQTDLSRQGVQIGEDEADYNAHLISGAAKLFRDRMIPVLRDQGAGLHEVLEILDRGVGSGDEAHDGAAQALHQAMVKALAPQPLLPCPDAIYPIPINRAVVPPAIDRPNAGARFRSLLAPGTSIAGHRFPEAALCDGQYARVLRDFGARMLTHAQGVALLAAADPQKTRLAQHPEVDLRVDPVLDVLEGLWETADGPARDEVETAAREHPVFPVHTRPDGTVARVSTQGATCFYPPRHLTSDVPLARLHFLHRDVCWGGLLPRDREKVLDSQMVAWKAIFGMDEFAFAPVMQKSVTPALRLDEDDDTLELRRSLESIESLAQICQLAGRTNPKPDHPLAYERLGSDRLLFPLSRLRVPCRRRPGADLEWLPAYRVYFGRDWLGDATTVEDVLEAATSVDPTGPVPELPVLAPFSEFEGVLAVSATVDGPGEVDPDDADDVSEDENEETTEDLDERARWMAFLEWIGVNRVLRPRHFHDVEDRGSGWLRTKDRAGRRNQRSATLVRHGMSTHRRCWRRSDAEISKQATSSTSPGCTTWRH